MDTDKDYKAIRLLGLFSTLLSVVSLALWIWCTFRAAPASALSLAQLMWVVFGLVGGLATRVASIVDRQSDEIADLRRLLSERASRA